jgi:hypothetical protein
MIIKEETKDGSKLTVDAIDLRKERSELLFGVFVIFLCVSLMAFGLGSLGFKSAEIRTKMQLDAEVQKEAIRAGATCTRVGDFEITFHFCPVASRTASAAEKTP